MSSVAISESLKELLELEGKTPYRLSKDTGLALRSIHHWLRGVYYPDAEALLKLADYFKISVDVLLGLKEQYGEKSEKKSPSIINAQKTLVKYLEKYLQKKNFTKYRLAKSLKVGQGTVARWFQENAMPETTILVRISELLGQSLDELLGRK